MLSAMSSVLILPPSLVFWRQHEGQEFVSGIQQGIYLEMQLPMIRQALESPDSRLTSEEKKRVLRYYRKLTARGIIIRAIKSKKLPQAQKLASRMGLTASDFLQAVFAMRKDLN